jgi:hypothetical protein
MNIGDLEVNIWLSDFYWKLPYHGLGLVQGESRDSDDLNELLGVVLT